MDCLTVDGATVAVAPAEDRRRGPPRAGGPAGDDPARAGGRRGGPLARPASRALRVGDIVVGYGDRSAPTYHQLLEINRQYAGAGHAACSCAAAARPASCGSCPEQHDKEALVGLSQVPDLDHPVVAGVREGSPAARAGHRTRGRHRGRSTASRWPRGSTCTAPSWAWPARTFASPTASAPARRRRTWAGWTRASSTRPTTPSASLAPTWRSARCWSPSSSATPSRRWAGAPRRPASWSSRRT